MRCYALEQPNVDLVLFIGRRKIGISHSKLTEFLHAVSVMK
jgi:hypothetical protein